VEALAALGFAPTENPTRGDLRPIRPGIVFGGANGDPAASSYELGTPAQPLPAGEYGLEAVCLGQGRVTVSAHSSSVTPVDVDLVVECGGGVGAISFTMDSAGILELTIRPGGEAMRGVGVAAAITDPRIVAARTAIGPPPETTRSGGEAVLYNPVVSVDESGTEVGDYTLTVACAGTGTVDVTFDAGTTSASQPIVCTPPGTLAVMTLTSPATGLSTTVSIVPNETATGRAAVTYRVTRG
jgi:hypothetical protein